MRVAVLNAGSSSIKGALLEVEAAGVSVCTRAAVELDAGADEKEALSTVLAALEREGPADAVGHRIVHGGRHLTQPVQVDAEVEREIEALARLAPLHNPLGLAGIRAARERFPGRPMVAVFDTAFHAQRPEESLRDALPRQLCDSLDLLRYGFHGLAHASLVESLAAEEDRDASEVTAVTLQLGAGCSACAVERGASIETSMGFSPLGGLPMATRCGDLDPALVLELLRRGYSVHELDDLLTHESGLKGLAGTGDVREILRAEAGGDEHAALALRLFVRRIVAVCGAYLTLLGGRGALVFGGGIGSGSAEIRARVAAGLAAWNVELDPQRNASDRPGRVSADGGRSVYAFETDEERIIARSVYALLRPGAR